MWLDLHEVMTSRDGEQVARRHMLGTSLYTWWMSKGETYCVRVRKIKKVREGSRRSVSVHLSHGASVEDGLFLREDLRLAYNTPPFPREECRKDLDRKSVS